jgi:hypothetical protein
MFNPNFNNAAITQIASRRVKFTAAAISITCSFLFEYASPDSGVNSICSKLTFVSGVFYFLSGLFQGNLELSRVCSIVGTAGLFTSTVIFAQNVMSDTTEFSSPKL